MGADIVLVAVWRLEGQGHVIITDSFFNSVKLFTTLLEQGFFATGTIMKGSRGFPSSLAGFPTTHRPPCGTLLVKMQRSRKISALGWIDSQPVWLLSTALNLVDPNCTVQSWVRRERL